MEGSAEQKAYSEFNDRLNGMVVVGSDFQFLLKEKDVVGHRWLVLWPAVAGVHRRRFRFLSQHGVIFRGDEASQFPPWKRQVTVGVRHLYGATNNKQRRVGL